MTKEEDIAEAMLKQCVAGRTLQLARIVSQRYDASLKQHSLTSHQLTLLCLVAVLQPTTPSAMLPYLKMEQSTLSRNLDRLVDKGWLAKEHCPQDSRALLMTLTPAGSAKLREAHGSWGEAQEWAMEAFGKAGLASIQANARRLNPMMPLADE